MARVSISEAARLGKVSRTTLYRLIKQGTCPPVCKAREDH
ncbi:helix-turn-helix domain-containing protein [Klebsiella pneumoniae]